MGRAPTSGNCHTCRQRRVKCDQTRPACQRCVKGGLDCQGYDSVLRIQSHAAVSGPTPGTSRLGKIQTVTSFPEAPSKDKSAASNADSRRVAHRTKPDDESHSSSGNSDATADATRRAGGSGPDSPASASILVLSRPTSETDSDQTHLAPPRQLSLGAYRDNISFSYFFQSHSWITMHGVQLQDSVVQSYFLGERSDALESVRALAYGVFSRDHRDKSMAERAQSLYGNTLSMVRSRIDSTAKTEIAALIRPISLMASYAIAVDKDLRFIHQRGLARIMEYCGPEYFHTFALRPMFQSARLSLVGLALQCQVSSAVARRQACFLASPEWKIWTWPWPPGYKCPTDGLLDILADIPCLLHGIFEMIDNRLKQQSNIDDPTETDTSDMLTALELRAQKLEDDLAKWRTFWEERYPIHSRKVLSWAFHETLHESDESAPEIEHTALVSRFFKDLALYITIATWSSRLSRYIAAAAQSPGLVSTPFHTTCPCCTRIPPTSTIIPKTTTSPICKMSAVRFHIATVSDTVPPTPDVERSNMIVGPKPAAAAETQPNNSLPPEAYFTAQLRILAWLCGHLPDTHANVLGVLGSIALGHCAREAKRTAGASAVAGTVGRLLDRMKFVGADGVCLRSYTGSEWAGSGDVI